MWKLLVVYLQTWPSEFVTELAVYALLVLRILFTVLWISKRGPFAMTPFSALYSAFLAIVFLAALY